MGRLLCALQWRPRTAGHHQQFLQSANTAHLKKIPDDE